jgi:Fe-S cluster biogenesis protein NfuA
MLLRSHGRRTASRGALGNGFHVPDMPVLLSVAVSPDHETALRLIREVIAPLIRADGGQLYLVSPAQNGIALHLAGRYSGCPGNTLARRRVIEPALRAVAPKLEITITSGALIPAGAELLG